MKPYKNSDDYTRLVVDFAVEDVFQDAAAKFQAKRITEKQFLRLSKLSKFDSADQQQVVKLLSARPFDPFGLYMSDGSAYAV